MALLAATAGGVYWYEKKKKVAASTAPAAPALQHQQATSPAVAPQPPPRPPQAITNPATAVLAMIAGAKSGNHAAIFEAKATLDSFSKPARGDRKVARQRNNLGLDALKVKAYDGAISRFTEGVAADPSDVELKNNLGYALMMAGRLDDARKVLFESLALDSGRASAWANLGQTFAKQGDEGSAVAAFVNTFIFSRAQNKTIEFLTNLSQTDADPRIRSTAARALQTSPVKDGAALPSFPPSTPYRTARAQLISSGWQPVKIPGAPKCMDGDARCANFPEVRYCGVGARAACGFTWERQGLLIEVVGIGEEEQRVDSVSLCTPGRCQ